ncbi:uncharacterized protein ARMOST_02940 [Armillaria ostoyae]|uniref:Uncharacterized protein n=1 Tax=Armillaria ostoyae TaxID=47428 RepID=A0A284QT12_ARMOS|nr:uncharacterized protein ARMOST_02940 [Armillaria ostoyae]
MPPRKRPKPPPKDANISVQSHVMTQPSMHQSFSGGGAGSSMLAKPWLETGAQACPSSSSKKREQEPSPVNLDNERDDDVPHLHEVDNDGDTWSTRSHLDFAIL